MYIIEMSCIYFEIIYKLTDLNRISNTYFYFIATILNYRKK